MTHRIHDLIKTLTAVLIGVLFFVSCEGAVSAVSDGISKKQIRRHMEYIASEETQGRMTASSGYRKAADYVVEKFVSYGLEPGWTDSSGKKTFFQPVPFIRNRYGTNNILSVRKEGKTEELLQGRGTYLIADPGKGPVQLTLEEPVFVGYGIHEPESGWDDFSNLDIQGKLAVMLAGFPADSRTGPDFPQEVRRTYSDRRNGDALRFQNVAERGALGIIALPDRWIAGHWDAVYSQLTRSMLAPAEIYGSSSRERSSIPSLLVHPDTSGRLFDGLGFDPLSHDGDYRTHKMNDIKLSLTLDIKSEPVVCHNIIAVVPGTDPELRREHITLGAHLDHLGKEGDVVFPGANDNASSCALILGVAEAVAHRPLKRSVMFVLFTAEEIGHYGSLHFVAHPPVPHEQVMLNINLEQIGAKSRRVDGIGANGPGSLEGMLRTVQKKHDGMPLQFDDIESTVAVISGSDTLSFYQQGLPAVLLGSGGFPEHHTPDDDLDLIDFEHLHGAALFVLDFIIELGDH